MQDLLKEFQLLLGFHISRTKHVSLRPHLSEDDKKMVNTAMNTNVRLVWGVKGLPDLAARSNPRASGASRLSRASCTRTMASVFWSSRGVSEVASNGTVFSVKDSDNCTQKTERLYSVLEEIMIMTGWGGADSHTDLEGWSPQLFLHNLPGLYKGLWTSFWRRGLFFTARPSPPHLLFLESKPS